MTVLTYRDLDVWKQAMELVVACYRTTASFPVSETYGLTGAELVTCIELGARLGYLSNSDERSLGALNTSVGRRLNALYQSLSRRCEKPGIRA